jgi:(3,5-dihydroxyphenyl)acetyl-CoA 1,2-dioxygenase
VTAIISGSDMSATLEQAGLGRSDSDAWVAARPTATGDLDADRREFGAYWSASAALLDRLPVKTRRSVPEQAAAEAVLEASRASREAFLAVHVERVYEALTDGRRRFVRVDDLVSDAAVAFPGLVPSATTLEAEAPRMLAHKDGHEVDQGLFLAHVLANVRSGMHLCHAMLLPHQRTAELVEIFGRTGHLDLGTTVIDRQGASAIMTFANPDYLNAEDAHTVEAQELGVDICSLDAGSEVAVMRGSRIPTGKYAGRRVFSAGINLTHLYHGKIPFIWYLVRELGWVSKVFRGIASPDRSPEAVLGHTHEKLWIAAVDAFAIGGGCQYMLVTDINVAASDAYLTLPARKEGIIPGAANLRLPRFVGDRIARQAIMMERRIDCDSPEGRMICDYVVEPDRVDQAVTDIVDQITSWGVVSASSNRKSFRVGDESLDHFRRYLAVYAREQAYCHFNPALIRNLEHFWNAKQRRVHD